MIDNNASSPLDKPAAGSSRRTILRVGGTVAWATPVIVAISSAPAFAASMARITVVGNPGPGIYGGIDPNLIFTNETATPVDPGPILVRAISDSQPEYFFPQNWINDYVRSEAEDGRPTMDVTLMATSPLDPGESRGVEPFDFIQTSGPIDFIVTFLDPPTGVTTVGTSFTYAGDPGAPRAARAPRTGARSSLTE